MKSWKLLDAQDHFAELVQFCTEEPQLVCEQNIPRAVVIDIKLFKELTESQLRQQSPTIEELLNELQEIKTFEPVDIDTPERRDREQVVLLNLPTVSSLRRIYYETQRTVFGCA